MIDGLLHSCSQKTAIAIACTETTTSSHKRTPVHQLFASSWVDCTFVTSHCAQGLLSLIIRQSLALSLRSPPASTSLIHPQFPCRVFPLQSPLAIVLFSPSVTILWILSIRQVFIRSSKPYPHGAYVPELRRYRHSYKLWQVL